MVIKFNDQSNVLFTLKSKKRLTDRSTFLAPLQVKIAKLVSGTGKTESRTAVCTLSLAAHSLFVRNQMNLSSR